MRKKVFLGGTLNGSKWRNEIIPHLETNNLDYFNPVSEDGTERSSVIQIRQRTTECDYLLYCITPKMIGYLAIAELVNYSIKKPTKTIAVFLEHDEYHIFSRDEWDSILQVKKIVHDNGAMVFHVLKEAAEFLGIKD